MLADNQKTKLWDINYSTYNFSDQDLNTGKDLCQFYTQWQYSKHLCPLRPIEQIGKYNPASKISFIIMQD